jgi:hypothetical protein
MTKLFPKTRICIVDLVPPFEEGVKKALGFVKKYNIPVNTADGRRIITSFCIDSIQRAYNSIKSPFPKATCLSRKKIPSRLVYFIENYFESVLKIMPIYYCGSFELTSPDLECAAENSLKRQVSQRDYTSLMTKLKIRKIA